MKVKIKFLFCLVLAFASFSEAAHSQSAQIQSECGMVEIPQNCEFSYSDTNFQACTGMEYAGKPTDSSDLNDLNDPRFRKFFNSEIVNLSKRPITCSMTISATYSVYNADSLDPDYPVLVDYCQPSLMNKIRPKTEVLTKKITLNGCSDSIKGRQKAATQTPGFQYEYARVWPNSAALSDPSALKPVYCPMNSGASVSCSLGCDKGEVEISGECKPGCKDPQGKYYPEAAKWDALTSFGETKDCKLTPMKCDKGEILEDTSKPSFNGVLKNSQCVNECYDINTASFKANGSTWEFDSWSIEGNTPSPGKACSLVRTNYSCNSSQVRVGSSSKVFNGYLDKSNQCKADCEVVVAGARRHIAFGSFVNDELNKIKKVEVKRGKLYDCYYMKRFTCEASGPVESTVLDQCVLNGGSSNH